MTCPDEVLNTSICRKRGDTYPIEITVLNKTTGNAKDITGASFKLSVSDENAPATAAYIFQSDGNITDAENGIVEFPITTSDADHIGNLYYDIQMTSGAVITTIMGGTFTLVQDITK